MNSCKKGNTNGGQGLLQHSGLKPGGFFREDRTRSVSFGLVYISVSVHGPLIFFGLLYCSLVGRLLLGSFYLLWAIGPSLCFECKNGMSLTVVF